MLFNINLFYLITHFLLILLMLINMQSFIVHVSHSALIFTNTTCDFNNALVNAEINMN